MNVRNTAGKYKEEENRTFQWAELVAKMYKVMGILSDEEHSCKYMPVHFTNKKTMKLQNGEFGPQWTLLDPDLQ